MPDGQYYDFPAVIAIEGNIRPTSELNYPFSKLCGQLLDRATHLWEFAEQFYSLADRLDGASGRLRTLGS